MTTARVSLSAALLLAFLSVLVPSTAFGAQVNVGMTSMSFTPANITINVGDTVVWANSSAIQHTVTANDYSFNSGVLNSGQTYSRTFTTPGTYNYNCLLHPGMTGTITVVAQSQTSQTSQTTQTTYTPVYTPVTTSSNPTVADLQAQVQALLTRLQQLQAELAAGTVSYPGTVSAPTHPPGTVPPTSACPLIGRVLSIGDSGDDVIRLQQFLARDPNIYPERLVTGYYGALTQAAVQRWQVRYNIVSSGTPETTGFGQVGPRTAASMSLQCANAGGGGSGSTIPGNTGAVGGYLRVTPVSGSAPLTVSVEATVNSVNSCNAATYTVEYGDGTAPAYVTVPAGRCQQLVQTLSHTYNSSGTYQITLSAGAHRTSVTVNVSGSSSSGSLSDSMSASPNTGQAPLSVTFAGTINGSRSCGGGSYTLNFGDGQSISIPYPADSCQAHSFSVVHQYVDQGSFTANLYRGAQSSGNLVANDSITVSGGSSPVGPFTVTPGIDGNPSKVKIDFDISTPCSSYDLDWGDGSSHVTQSQGSGSCAQVVTQKTFTHTYTGSGSYTIKLIRSSRTDTATITITSS